MVVKLDDVCERIYAGGDVPKDRFSDTKTDIYNIPIYANAEANQGLYGYTDRAREFDNAVTVAARGTIGYSAIRTEPFLPVVRLITVVPNRTKITLSYLYYALRHYKPKSSGTSIPQLTVPNIKKYTFNLYDINRQEIITTTLDKLQSIIANRKQQLAKLDELVKARFVEMFGDCRTNPKGWRTVALGDISDVGSSKRVFVEELQETGIPFYRGTEIGALAEGKSISPELFITEEHYNTLIDASGKPEIGDLLMPSICPDGRIWVVDSDEPFYFKDGRVLWVHSISENFDPVFLLYTLKDRIMTDYGSIASGTTFAELKIFALKQCKVFDVPLEEQHTFAKFIAQTDKSKVVVQKALDEAQLLFDSLMQEYFG